MDDTRTLPELKNFVDISRLGEKQKEDIRKYVAVKEVDSAIDILAKLLENGFEELGKALSEFLTNNKPLMDYINANIKDNAIMVAKELALKDTQDLMKTPVTIEVSDLERQILNLKHGDQIAVMFIFPSNPEEYVEYQGFARVEDNSVILDTGTLASYILYSNEDGVPSQVRSVHKLNAE